MLYFMQLWHHYLEYFYSSCMEKSSGHTEFFISRSIHIEYIVTVVTRDAMFETL